MKKVFSRTIMQKKYCDVNSKLKIAPTFSVWQDENNLPIISDFNKASLFNRAFQKVFVKDDENKNFNLIDKN